MKFINIRTTFSIIVLLLIMLPLSHSQKFGKVDRTILKQEEHPVYPEAEAAYLIKNCNTYYDWLGAKPMLVSEYWFRIKVYKEEAISYADFDWKLYKNGSDRMLLNDIKCFAVNLENEEVVKTKLKKKDIYRENFSDDYNKVAFAIPAVKVGTVIDLKYTIKSPFLYTTPRHYFQNEIPVESTMYSISVPNYFTMTPVPSGVLPLTKSQKKSRASGREADKYSFSAKDVPPMLDDDYALNINDYKSSIKYELHSVAYPRQEVYRYSENWDQIAKNLMNSKTFGKVLDDNVKEANTIIETALELDMDQRVKYIYDHVRENIKWNKDYNKYCEQKPAKVYKTKLGSSADINLLLINLLKKADVSVYPLVTKKRNNGIMNQLFPSITEINYVIAAIPKGEEYLLLDASSKYVPLGQLPIRAINKYGLLVNKEGGQIINIPNQNLISVQKFAKLDIDTKDNSLIGTATIKRSKFAATKSRIELDEKEEDEDDQDLEENDDDKSDDAETEDDLEDEEEVDLRENQYEVTSAAGIEDVYSAIKMEYDVQLYNSIQSIGPDIFIDAFVIDEFEKNPFDKDEREYPAFFNSKYNLSYISMINKPEGYSVKSIPENISIKMDGGKGSFKYVVSEDTEKINVRCVVKVDDTMFLPEEYDMLRRFFEAILEKQSEKIVLTKG